MAKKHSKAPDLQADLQTVDRLIADDLYLPSLREQIPRVQGYAYRFFLVLPLFCAKGKRVFTDEHLSHLFVLFNARCGGCLASSSRSGAPFFGEYLPDGTNPVRDYHTVIIVYANPIEPSDRFFREIKSILKKAPLIEQEEILIERSEVWLW